MPNSLTDLERSVLDYLIEYLRSHTYQPSIREIGSEFAIRSTKTVSELLQSLADKGWIERDPSRSRGVRLIGLEMRSATSSVPLYESADAPAPSGFFEIDRKLAPSHAAYLLPMHGDHLLEDGVRAGDLLLIEPVDASGIQTGDLVLAATGARPTARRCALEAGALVLEPIQNEEVAISLTPRQASSVVRGRVAAVVRRLRIPAPHASPSIATLA